VDEVWMESDGGEGYEQKGWVLGMTFSLKLQERPWLGQEGDWNIFQQ